MLILLSPAKTLDESSEVPAGIENPHFKKEAGVLVDTLVTHSPSDLKKLMSISDKLADLNYSRYQNFSSRYTTKNSKAAIHTFKGDVYVGLDAATLKQKELDFAQKHVRILSGLYGILRPMDKMQPYRLEMGTKLKNPGGKDLYAFWRDDVTKRINTELKALKSELIINLASNEYFHVLDKTKLKANIIDIGFKEYRDDKLKFISYNAKKARGFMTRYIIQNKVKNVEGLKGFNTEGYAFEASLSEDNQLLFTR